MRSRPITLLVITCLVVALAGIVLAAHVTGGVNVDNSPSLFPIVLYVLVYGWRALLIVLLGVIYWIASRHRGETFRSLSDGESAVLAALLLVFMFFTYALFFR
jgi:hypothetical protein